MATWPPGNAPCAPHRPRLPRRRGNRPASRPDPTQDADTRPSFPCSSRAIPSRSGAPRCTSRRTHARPPAGRRSAWPCAAACAASSGPPRASGRSTPRTRPFCARTFCRAWVGASSPLAQRTWRPCHDPCPTRARCACGMPCRSYRLISCCIGIGIAMFLSSRARPAAIGRKWCYNSGIYRSGGPMPSSFKPPAHTLPTLRKASSPNCGKIPPKLLKKH